MLPLWHCGYLIASLRPCFCDLWSLACGSQSSPSGRLVSKAAKSGGPLAWKAGKPCTHTHLWLSSFQLQSSWATRLLRALFFFFLFFFLDEPCLCWPLCPGKTLPTACISLIWGSICSTSVNIPPRREWLERAGKYCRALNGVWFLRSSSVHITQPFKELYIFFCSCQFSLNRY